jgi:hypothetical protein
VGSRSVKKGDEVALLDFDKSPDTRDAVAKTGDSVPNAQVDIESIGNSDQVIARIPQVAWFLSREFAGTQFV